MVNDDSSDRTWDTICELAQSYQWVRGIHLMRNYGQHNATLCGARAAHFDVSVTMDDDLQQPPAEMPKLLAKLNEAHDLVYGISLKKTHAFYRFALSWIIRYAMAAATRQNAPRELSAYRAYKTTLRRAFTDVNSPQCLFDALLGWGTTRVATTPVIHNPRRKGRSNYGFRSLVNVALLLWVGYSTAPLRFATLLGFLFVVFGIGVLAYVVWIYFYQGSLPGFSFLASTIAIFGGVQLFTLGMIGEYLARMFTRSMNKPVYVVKEFVSRQDRPADIRSSRS